MKFTKIIQFKRFDLNSQFPDFDGAFNELVNQAKNSFLKNIDVVIRCPKCGSYTFTLMRLKSLAMKGLVNINPKTHKVSVDIEGEKVDLDIHVIRNKNVNIPGTESLVSFYLDEINFPELVKFYKENGYLDDEETEIKFSILGDIKFRDNYKNDSMFTEVNFSNNRYNSSYFSTKSGADEENVMDVCATNTLCGGLPSDAHRQNLRVLNSPNMSKELFKSIKELIFINLTKIIATIVLNCGTSKSLAKKKKNGNGK